MNKYEEISAYQDGESTRTEESLLADLQADPGLRTIWCRYQMINQSLRGQLAIGVAASSLSERVSAALTDEPAILSPQKRRRSLGQRMMKPAAGMAIAASVALVAIVGLRGLDQATNPAGQVTPASSVATDSAGGSNAARVSTAENRPMQSLQPASQAPLARTVSTDAESAGGYRRSGQYGFNSYLINHNEYRASAGVRGSMPYARIVAPGNSDR